MNTERGPQNTQGNTYVPQYVNYQIEGEELHTQLTRRDTQLAVALNFKTNGIYDKAEVQTGEQFFGEAATQQKKRGSFRKVFDFGAIAVGGNTVIDHGITGISQCTHIYGTAVTVADFRPIPFASVTAATAQIEVVVTGTQITVTNGATAPAITSGIIVLEYLKN